MSDKNRVYSKQDEASDHFTLEEIKAKIVEAEKILYRLNEEERKLQQEIKSREFKSTRQNDIDPYIAYAKESAEETASFIQENAELKIKEMVCKVRELQANHNKEITSIQERIDTKKRYIVTMFESLMIYLEDGSLQQSPQETAKEENDKQKTEPVTGVDQELQSLLKQFM